jgi:nucleoside-diphosphate-sugar epimerase
VAAQLQARGDQVIGLDNLDDYDVSLKRARLEQLQRPG